MSTLERRIANSFLIGAGFGLLAGLLWAPKPGKETRDRLQRGADDGLAYLREEAERVRADSDSWLNRLQSLFCGSRTSRPD
jgi:gas vesicle protein